MMITMRELFARELNVQHDDLEAHRAGRPCDCWYKDDPDRGTSGEAIRSADEEAHKKWKERSLRLYGRVFCPCGT